MATGSELYDYVTDSGVIIPDTSSIKESVEQTFQDAFGSGVDLTDESVGGRLVERDVAALSQTIGVVALNANQFNPHYSTGAYLDHLANMFGFSRSPATKTRVYARLTGTASTVIPAGSMAKTENGDSFISEADITIGADTYGSGWFVAETAGSVACGVGELNSIQTNVSGWTKITNLYSSVEDTHPELATVIGNDIETDTHLRSRLLESVWSGVGFAQSVKARVADVAGVKSCIVLENWGPQPKVIRGVTVPGHSICVCVDGGDNTDVARAIYASRSAGCGYATSVEGASNIQVDIPDEYNGIVHAVHFVRPPTVLQGLSVTITGKATGFASSITLVSAVSSAVNAYLQDIQIGAQITNYSVQQAIIEALPMLSISSTVVMTTGNTPIPIAEYNPPAYMKYTCEAVVINPA